MASLSTFSISRPNPPSNPSTSLNPIQFPFFHLKKSQTQFPNSSISAKQSSYKYCSLRRPTKLKSATEDEQPLVPEEETAPAPAGEASDPTVSVPVSPLDVLTMFFQADGTMSEAAVPAVTKALQEVEGISDLKVQLVEGIASVELKKQTTVQATGVASNLVEIIQGSGFKLQTLNLSFQDEEDSS